MQRATTPLTALGLGLILLACGPVTPNQIDCSDQGACGAHGACDSSGSADVCVCDHPWTGPHCDRCLDGYTLNGGICVAANTCVSTCADQGRTCIGVEGDVICGGCLEGWFEEDGRCMQACASESNPGELVPLDLYIMLDRSASMADEGKWDAVEAAITGFVNATDTAGIGVGLQFFPVPAPSGTIPSGACTSDADCGLYGPCIPMLNQCGGSLSSDSCDPADYEGAEVPIQTLPGVQSAIVSAISAAGPDGDSTPTQPAYEGAVTYAAAWAQAHPDHLTFIVFASDGEPTGCTTNSTSATAAMAATAAAANPSVKTFVIGVGTELSNLNDIAASGGTTQAYLVDTGGNVTQQFIDALNEIRANGLCKYQIPQPDGGAQVNYDEINVSTVDPQNPTASVTVPNVGSESGCDATVGGWYYDDPLDPQLIQLCPVTCEDVQLNDLRVDVLVGCQTVVL